MGYFDPKSSIKKIEEETGISNIEATPSVRAQQPVAPAATKPQGNVNKGKKCPLWIRPGDCARLGYNPK